jgi:DHA1 family bicyclomycin/chloramphenicol resistance-like MFS transporter
MAKSAHPFLKLLLGALVTVTPFSIDMYLPAFPQMAQDLGTTVPGISLSLSSYFIGIALGQLAYGPLLDRFGRKRPLYIGLTAYLIATLACASARTLDSLIAFRFLQALGGCAASVGSTAMVRDFFPAQERAKVFSQLMLILSVSPMLAPTVGSWITITWHWPAVFITLALIVLAILAVSFSFLPEGHRADATISIHPRGVAREYWNILRKPQFLTYAVTGGLCFAGLFVYLAGSSALFMDTFQLDARAFGMLFAALSVGVIGGGQFNILLSRWFKSTQIFRTAVTTQVVLAAIFLLVTSTVALGLTAHVVFLFAYLSCIGLVMPNASALSIAPFDRTTGSAAALLGFLQMGTGAVSSAIYSRLSLPPRIALGSLFLATSGLGAVLFWSRREG